MKWSKAVLNDLPGELYKIEADDKVPDNFKYLLTAIQAAHNQSKLTEGLAKLLKLKICAKVILTVIIDILGGQVRYIRHIEFA